MTPHTGSSRDERSAVLNSVIEIFEKRLYDPALNGIDFRSLAASRSEEILSSPDFVGQIKALLAETGVHPTDFYHESSRTVPLDRLIKATFHQTAANGSSWMFQDVHLDGPAYNFGIRPGYRLTGLNGQPVAPGVRPYVPAGSPVMIEFQRPDLTAESFQVDGAWSPGTKKQRDKTRYVSSTVLDQGVGYIRASMFPGALGMDVARQTDRALKALKGAARVIVDLRGNFGSAGAGNLRLMSYLTPDKIPVGYSLTRRRAEQGYRREDLIQFRRIPRSMLAVPFLLWRFRKADKSIVVVTEGLGGQTFHGRIVMLVNEHTISGAEIVAGFAADHKLATIVGSRTSGRLLAWSSLPVGQGFFMTIPIGNYLTWEGKSFEGTGVLPDVHEAFSPESASAGRDNQLHRAFEIVKSL